MSRFNRASSAAGSLLSQLATVVKTTGSQHINQNYAQNVASLESLDETQFNVLNSARTGLAASMESAASSVGVKPNSLGMEAAIIAGLAAGAPGTYRAAALRANVPAGLHVFESAPSGSASMESSVPALEGFNEQSLEKYTTFSIAFNMIAAKQSAWGEAFFPMIVATPDQTFFVAEIRRATVWNGQVHSRDGNRSEWKKSTLIEALRNPEVLKNNVSEAVPFYDPAQNAAHFMATNLGLAPADVLVGGDTVKTHPLKASVRGNLLGLIQHPGLIKAGQLNQTDEIDRNVRIKHVYVTATKGSDVSLHRFNVSGNQTSQFQKTPQGHANAVRASLVDMEGVALVGKVGGGVAAVDGAASVALAGLLEKQTVRLEIGMFVDLNVETGNIEATARAVSVASVFDADGRKLAVSGFTALEDVTFEIVGFDLDARRTNANRRSRGLIMDTDGYREAYTVGLLSPIVVQTPAAGEKLSDDDKVKQLALGCHIQMDNNAVATVLNYAETLKAYNTNAMQGLVADIYGGSLEGIGRLLVTPFYKERTIDIMAVVNSLTSSDKVGDLRAYFTNLISQDAYEMFQQSGYDAAKQVVYGNTEGKNHLVIGTDQVLQNYVMIQGDDRTAGPTFDVTLVSTPNKEMYGKVVIAPKDTHSKGELAVLGSGNCIYIPELVSDLPVNREGATVNEVMIQPRFRHICNCPMLIVYHIERLADFIANKTEVLVDNKEV